MSLIAKVKESLKKKKELSESVASVVSDKNDIESQKKVVTESLNEEVKESLNEEVTESLNEEVTESLIEEEETDDLDIPYIDSSFDFYGKKWVLADHMKEILEGNYELIPIECLFTHYILRYDFHCLYIALDDHNTGDDFEVYEFEWVGEHISHHGENEMIEPDFVVVESSLTAIECSHFLIERIKEGYQIFIEKRKEFE